MPCKNCRRISGREALEGYNAGERMLGITTRCIELGEEDKWDES